MKHTLSLVALAALVLIRAGAFAQEKARPDTARIPQSVMAGLTAKFPEPVIAKWTRESEAGRVLYDIEFTQGGRKFEADIEEDGTIQNWEKAITANELPASVKQAVKKKYPNAAMEEIIEITAIKHGKEKLEGFEISLKTKDKEGVELTVAPDGRILDHSVEKK